MLLMRGMLYCTVRSTWLRVGLNQESAETSISGYCSFTVAITALRSISPVAVGSTGQPSTWVFSKLVSNTVALSHSAASMPQEWAHQSYRAMFTLMVVVAILNSRKKGSTSCWNLISSDLFLFS